MKTRIITGASLILVLLVMVLAAPKIVAALVFGVMLAVGSYEMLYTTGVVRHPRLVIYASVMAFLMTMWSYLGADPSYLILLALAFIVALFTEMMLDHVKVTFDMLAMTFFAGMIMPWLLGAVIRILCMKIGRYIIMIPFFVAYLNDGGAYFVGMKFGKHKLAPVVSPNKTIEGLLGGLATSVVGMLLYGALMQFAFKFQVNYTICALYGLVGGSMGVFGDLMFSVIKRQTGIKDYGNIFPGHGGVMDRIDSLMMVAPLIEVLLTILPMAV